MPLGEGGKYDAQCEKLFFETGAAHALVIVIGGTAGSGFSMTSRALDPVDVVTVAALLEDVARQLREDAEKLPKGADA